MFVGLVAEGEEAKAETQAFIDHFHIPWPTGYGAMATIEALGVQGFPSILVIGADGRIAWNDELSGTLDDAIEQALVSAKQK